ncbi:orexin receptor type 2 [Biomphalaria glabrata]
MYSYRDAKSLSWSLLVKHTSAANPGKELCPLRGKLLTLTFMGYNEPRDLPHHRDRRLLPDPYDPHGVHLQPHRHGPVETRDPRRRGRHQDAR